MWPHAGRVCTVASRGPSEGDRGHHTVVRRHGVLRPPMHAPPRPPLSLPCCSWGKEPRERPTMPVVAAAFQALAEEGAGGSGDDNDEERSAAAARPAPLPAPGAAGEAVVAEGPFGPPPPPEESLALPPSDTPALARKSSEAALAPAPAPAPAPVPAPVPAPAPAPLTAAVAPPIPQAPSPAPVVPPRHKLGSRVQLAAGYAGSLPKDVLAAGDVGVVVGENVSESRVEVRKPLGGLGGRCGHGSSSGGRGQRRQR